MFDRFDICAAYLALENDWHQGGILRARPSNMRRRESTGVQLRRMGYRPGRGVACAFEYLENENQRAIYCDALRRFGLPLDAADSSHAAILQFIERAENA